jgi:hypothetical protein
MGLVEGVGDLDRNLEGVVDLEPPSFEFVGEGLAFEILHDEVISPVLVPDVEQRANMSMRQGGNRFGFALETRLQLGISGGQNLDGDDPIQARVAGAIDFAHAARASQRDDFVRAEAGAADSGKNEGDSSAHSDDAAVAP